MNDSPAGFNSTLTAERTVLGSILRAPDTYWALADTLRPDHFVSVLHQRIYSMIGDIAYRNGRVSVQLLITRLGDEIEGVSLGTELSTMILDAEDVGSVHDFSDEIIDGWARRKAGELLKKAGKLVHNRGHSISDTLAMIEAQVAEISGGSQAVAEVPIYQAVTKVISGAQKAAADENFVPGFDTGLQTLDSMLGHLRPGRLYIIGGAQKEGKTALATQIVMRAAESVNVLMAQGEMTDEEIGLREIAKATGISATTIDNGNLTMHELERIVDRAEDFKRSGLFIWTPGDMRIAQIRNRCFAVKRSRGGLGMLMVDHLLHVSPDKEYDNEFRGIAKVIRGLKQIAIDLGIPVICLVHRTRSAQDRNDPTPFASDHYGGGAIERDCDAMISIFRRDRWLELRRPRNGNEDAIRNWEDELAKSRNKAQVALLAHRHASFPRIEEFQWNGSLTRFEEL